MRISDWSSDVCSSDPAPRPPLAVIFYGSNLRSGRLDGVLDFYVLVERMSEWHEGVAAIFDTLLAPRTEYRELLLDGVLLRAQVSIISIVRFNRLIRDRKSVVMGQNGKVS